ncbi:tape measure domain protein [Streptococcus mitis SK579]|jgi:phage protein|nr:tape measure domain protein [Streptococcus mitis SK579]DAU78556.1 MAG TPA: tail tape measure [Caudoviricetes sp.]
MAETYSVEAVLTAVDKGMSSTLNGLQKAINGLQKTSSAFDTISNKSGSMFKSMLGANLVSSAVTSAFGSIRSSLGEMVGELNSSKKAWDTFDGNLSKLGWGKDQINQAKEAMQDYATKTIYSASDMASTFSQMAAIGRQDSGELVEAMGGLAASAENPKQAMKSLSQQMVQALAKPKITWQDFRIMMEQAPAGMSAVAKEMGLSLNELITKIQAGQVKTEDFAEAFKRAGMSMQDMATSYKTIDQALDGLKETLANKLKPAFDALSKAGIKALEAIMNQLDKIDFNKLATSLEEVLNKIDFNAIAEKIASFVSTSVAKIKEFWQGFSNTSAIADFKKALSEVWEAIKKVASALSGGDMASFGEKIGKGLSIASQAIQSFAKVVQSLSPEQIRAIASAFLAFKTAQRTTKLATDVLIGLNSAVSTTKSVFGGLQSATRVGTALFGIARGSKAASSALYFMSETSTLAKVAVGGLNIFSKIGGWIGTAVTAIISFLGPVGLVIAAIVAIGAAFVFLWHKSEAFRNFFKGLWNGIVNVASSAWQKIQSAWSGLVEWFSNLWNRVKETASNTWNSFIEKAQPVIDAIKNAWNSITEFFSGLWEGIKQIVSDVWNSFLEGARPIVEGLMNVWNALKDFFSALWDGIVSVATTVWNGIVEVVTPIIEAIKTAWNSLVDFFTNLWNSITEGSTAAWNDFVEFLTPIVETIKGLWSGFSEFMSTIWNGIVDVATTAWNMLQPVIETVWTAIQQFITSAIQVIQNVITTGMQIVQEVWNAVWTVFTTIVQTVWTIISTIISTVLNVIAGIINTVTSIIKGDWSGAWENIKGIAQTVWEGIKSVISTVINAISTIIGTVLGTIKNTVTTIWNGIKDFISNTINNIKGTVINVANSLKDGFLNVLDSLKNGVSNAIEAVKSFFNRLWNIDLSGAGRAIMEGFLGGLKSMWGAVTDFVGGIASWIAAHKGPISYDRRLLIPAGQAIMSGFNAALMGGFEYVKNNVSGMADGIRSMFDDAGSRVSAMSNALQGDFSNNVSGTLSATYEVNQTKEPAIINLALGSNDFRAFVSDISNIQSKEERIRLKAQSL